MLKHYEMKIPENPLYINKLFYIWKVWILLLDLTVKTGEKSYR